MDRPVQCADLTSDEWAFFQTVLDFESGLPHLWQISNAYAQVVPNDHGGRLKAVLDALYDEVKDLEARAADAVMSGAAETVSPEVASRQPSKGKSVKKTGKKKKEEFYPF